MSDYQALKLAIRCLNITNIEICALLLLLGDDFKKFIVFFMNYW